MKNKYKTITGYKEAIKEDKSGDLHAQHMKYVHWMISKLTEEFQRIGSRAELYSDSHLSWPKPWILLRMEIVQLIWDLPEDVFRDRADYFQEFSELQEGDSLAVGPGKKQLVKLKRPLLYKRKKRIIQQAVKQREEAGGDEDDIIEQATMNLQMNNLVEALEEKMGTGGSTAASSSSAVEEAKPKAKAKTKAATSGTPQKQTDGHDGDLEGLMLDDAEGFGLAGGFGFEERKGGSEDKGKEDTPRKAAAAKSKCKAKAKDKAQSSQGGAVA